MQMSKWKKMAIKTDDNKKQNKHVENDERAGHVVGGAISLIN